MLLQHGYIYILALQIVVIIITVLFFVFILLDAFVAVHDSYGPIADPQEKLPFVTVYFQ